MNLVKVTPVVSQTSSKTGVSVFGRDMEGGSSTVADRAEDRAVKAAFWLKAEHPAAKLRKATDNFIVNKVL